MIGRASALPDVLPSCAVISSVSERRTPGADSFFSWEKVAFGLKPLFAWNHGVIYRGHTQGRDVGVVAERADCRDALLQYRARPVRVRRRRSGGQPARVLSAHAQSSQQDGLTGVKGPVRKVVSKDALERSRARSPRPTAPSNNPRRAADTAQACQRVSSCWPAGDAARPDSPRCRRFPACSLGIRRQPVPGVRTASDHADSSSSSSRGVPFRNRRSLRYGSRRRRFDRSRVAGPRQRVPDRASVEAFGLQ